MSFASEQWVGDRVSALTAEQTKALDVARKLVAAGVPVFVARMAKKKGTQAWDPKGGSGGCGFHLPSGWQRIAPDVRHVDSWRPGDALAAVMGHGLDLLDVDPRSGGDASLAALDADGIVPTVMARALTPSGGEHLFVRSLPTRSIDGFRPGLDFKAGHNGGGHGFAFIAPTVKVSKETGRPTPYQWDSCSLSSLRERDTSGEALRKLIESTRGKSGKGPKRIKPEDVQPVNDVQKAWALGEIASIAAELTGLPENGQHDPALRLARLAGGYVAGYGLDQEEVLAQLIEAGEAGPLRDAERTITDGLTHGLSAPIAPVPLEQAEAADRLAAVSKQHGEARFHVLFSRYLAARHSGEVMYVVGLGWHFWAGTHWQHDPTGSRPTQLAMALVSELLAEAKLAKDEPMQNQAAKAMKASDIAGIVRLAQADPSLLVDRLDDLDADPFLLNTPAGTIDLHSLKVRPHDPKDRITRISRGSYRPQDGPGEWDRFLTACLPDPDVRGFFKRFCGAALIGKVEVHKLLVHLGRAGRNGKTTATEALIFALGTYGAMVSNEIVLQTHQRGSAGADSKLMALRGVRLAAMGELPRGVRFDVEQLKALTGGDQIVAKLMRQDAVSFKPTHQLMASGNHTPGLDAAEQAAWARMLVIPWEQSFLGREDLDLPSRLQLCAGEVLTWAIDGLLEYQLLADLWPPAAVTSITQEIRTENDAIADFLADCCDTTDTGARVPHKELKAAYSAWRIATRRGGAPNAREVVKELELRGFSTVKRKGYPHIAGLRLSEPSEFPDLSKSAG